MFWLFAFIVLILILCVWFEDDKRITNAHVNHLADEARRRDKIHRSFNRNWFD
jgi:hypothetical protein